MNPAELSLFTDLNAHQLDRVQELGEEFTQPADTHLFQKGEEGDHIYILLDGKVEIIQELEFPQIDLERKEKILTTLEGKEKPVIGEINLLTQESFSATALCKEKCRFLKIKVGSLTTLCEEDKPIGAVIYRNIARLLALRLRRTNMDVVKLTLALSLAVKT